MTTISPSSPETHTPTRCCICFGQYDQVGELRDLMFVEPHGDTNTPEGCAPEFVRGWMCDECMVVHWAWDPNQGTDD